MIRNGSSRYVRHGALLLGVEGAALMRHVLDVHSTYLRAFAAVGPAVEACEEAAMEPDLSAGLLADAASAFWRDPAVLAWTPERTG